ncbi:MAG TPA: hypothetical protein VML75_10595, partial [Kofleriaceae bacterium]|nr:hypothetical protein [Kofleriaceae bacterium]
MCGLVSTILAGGWAMQSAEDVPLPPGVNKVPHDPSAFRPDPEYGEESYNADAQLKIYGDKRAVPVMRPLLELGREMYREGPFQPGINVVGKKNLVFANLLARG